MFFLILKPYKRAMKFKRNYLLIIAFLFFISIVILLIAYNFILPLSGGLETTGTIQIQKSNDVYHIHDQNQIVFVKGAAGNSNFSDLKAIGGNVIRTWSTKNIDAILDSALVNDLRVIVGLSIVESYYLDFYSDEIKVQKQFDKIESDVQRIKNHPALFMWIAGNELDFPYRFKYRKFYKPYRKIVKMIKKEDPDHPVTTSLVNFSRRTVVNVLIKVPELDFLSFNTFGGKLEQLRGDLERFEWFWNGPYLLTEWGGQGYWEVNQTQWSVPLENSSMKKAEQLRKLYKNHIPWDDGRNMGTCVFFWGTKQEMTQTWFSIFGTEGQPTQTVAELEDLWNNEINEKNFPQVDQIFFDDYKIDDILVFSNSEIKTARVHFSNTTEENIKITWHIMHEDWYYSKHLQQFDFKLDSDYLIKQEGEQLWFRVPEKEGPYRLYVYVENEFGNMATANLPFYVMNKSVD